MTAQTSAVQIKVQGIVQGVGFRPHVYSLATRNKLTGWVRNTSAGVEIELNGAPEVLEDFYQRLQAELPPLARIDHIERQTISPNGFSDFQIIESQPLPGDFLPVSPDRAICADCQRELFDPHDRRYRYPFINCTNCGPRFTIIEDIPYDRPKTTMREFTMCPRCRAEYDNPLDRRFHAQPTACAVCGPRLIFLAAGIKNESEAALQSAREWIKSGKIIAVKGLGGFHLACDAGNETAVAELRRRKKRSDKAFALMAFNMAAIETYAEVSPAERKALLSNERPIVLLKAKEHTNLAPSIAPGQKRLGFMLAYTPLHLLLLEPEQDFPDVLVMTSANLSEEPILYRDADVIPRLSLLADGYLTNDRPIHMRVDDSVMQICQEIPQIIRRARGFAPDAFNLPASQPSIFAAGAELKNTFCLTRDRYAFVSHFIGDLENYETLTSFEEGIQHYEKLFRIRPEIIACDLHPDYLASKYARQRAEAEGLPLVEVQHHHAHLAACLAENHWPDSSEKVIGVCFDGTGLGTDGAIWGGEFLVGNYREFARPWHLAYTPLPGGDAAARQPARMALAHLNSAGIDWDESFAPAQNFCADERSLLRQQIRLKLNTPMTSSMGRLFDAAASLCGVRQVNTYEGQAAIEFEALADPQVTDAYPFLIANGLIDPAPMWQALIADLSQNIPGATMAARFHNGIAQATLSVCQMIRQETGINTVALSGGVWQNQYLFTRAKQLLEAQQFQLLFHSKFPTNDGAIALGQAQIAAAIHQ